MNLIEQRKDQIEALGGTNIRTKDAVFILKSLKSVHWGKYNVIKLNSKRAVWYEYDALIVITNLYVLKLAWIEKNSKPAYDRIIEEVRCGNVTSLTDLVSEIGKYVDRHGSPVRLIETKLEYFL